MSAPATLLNRAVSRAIPAVPRPLVRFFSRRYIAGSTMDDALRVAHDLAAQGAMTTLDILGEFITRPEEAQDNTRAYEALLDRVAQDGLRDNYVSVKLSALGLLLDRQLCLDNMRRLLARAAVVDSFVRIDMEDSACTTPTLEIYERLREEFPGRIGIVLQAMLRRTLDDAERLAGRPLNIRLCKGIYVEPRRIAYVDPELVRRNYVLVLERLLRHQAYVGIATHDEVLVWEALRIVRELGLDRQRYEFQMLLGVDEELRRLLIDGGERVRIYVPYGQHWYKYSVRRLRENPRLAGYAFKALFARRAPRRSHGPAATPTPSP